MDRRTILQTVGVGFVTGLAGCSNDSDSNTEPETANSEPTAGDTNTRVETTTSETNYTDDETSTIEEFEWEDDLENAILNSPLSDVAPEGPSGAPAEYIQLNSTSEQLNYPLETLDEINSGGVDFRGETAQFTEAGDSFQYDSMYLIMTDDEISDSNGGRLYAWWPVSERWDENADLSQNLERGSGAVQRLDYHFDSDSLESIFGQDVTGYDEYSDEFPQTYLDLVEQ